jgi:hypothetical protein
MALFMAGYFRLGSVSREEPLFEQRFQRNFAGLYTPERAPKVELIDLVHRQRVWGDFSKKYEVNLEGLSTKEWIGRTATSTLLI